MVKIRQRCREDEYYIPGDLQRTKPARLAIRHGSFLQATACWVAWNSASPVKRKEESRRTDHQTKFLPNPASWPPSPSVITSGNTCVVRLRRLASWRPRCVISCRSFRLRPYRIWKVTWCLHRGPEHPRMLLVRVLAHVGTVSGVGTFWKEIGAAHLATQPFVCLAAECLC